MSEAVERSDVLPLGVPWGAVAEAIGQAGDVEGKILITCCTPLNEDFSGLTIGTHDSGAEFIQRLAPGARVVEAFNSVFATIFASSNLLVLCCKSGFISAPLAAQVLAPEI